MNKKLKFLTTILICTVFLCVALPSSGQSGEIGILPPDLDYQKICNSEKTIQKDNFDWRGKTPATSGLPDEKLLKLAEFYYRGTGTTPPNYERTRDILEYLINHSETLSNDAMFIKQDMLLKGLGYPQNTKLSKEILDTLLQRNEPKAHNRIAGQYVEQQEYTKAADHYKKAFVGGEFTAALHLAYLYHDKKIPGTQEEIDKSILLAQDSALQYLMRGNCHALTLVALMYRRLNNIPKSEYYSAKWFEKAAILDNPIPKLYLSYIIQRGFIFEYDEARILNLWKEAADLGSDRAMFLLGEHYVLNNKNDNDFKTGIEWFEKAAARRNTKSMQMLTEIYDGRYSGFKNEEKRQEWLEKLVETPGASGDTFMELADVYSKKKDFPQEKIFALYERASKTGNIDAYVKMGDSYRNGIGVPRAPVKALRFYRLAANNGNTDAIEALENAYSCGIGISKDPEKTKFWQQQAEYYESSSIIDAAYAFLESTSNDSAVGEQIKTDLTVLAVTREDIEAMILLGLYFKKMNDNANSEKWINSAIDNDKKQDSDYPAHAILGTLYLEGRYAAKDIQSGLSLLKAALEKNNPRAAEILGEWNWEQRNIPEAKKYLSIASDHGNLAANKILSDIAMSENNSSLATEYLKKSSRMGDVKSMLALAELYAKTPAATENETPEYWMNKAINAPPCDVRDFLFIAQSFADGKNGAPQNTSEASNWLKRAMADGIKDIKHYSKISEILFNSEAKFDKAAQDKFIDRLKSLTKAGNSDAASILTKLYLEKKIEQDGSFEPTKFLEDKAQSGDVKSMIALARMHLTGYGTQQSFERGIELLQKAANAGSTEAKELLETFNR
jgi:TPR repeat protein